MAENNIKKNQTSENKTPVTLPSKKNGKTLATSLDFKNELKDIKQKVKDAADSSWISRMVNSPVDKQKLPVGMKIFGVLCAVVSALALAATIVSVLLVVHFYKTGEMSDYGTSTVVVMFAYVACRALLCLSFLWFGIAIFRNRRRWAALIIYMMYILLIAGAICCLMLEGVSIDLITWGVAFGILVAFQIYLDPGLRDERKLQHKLHDSMVKTAQEEGTLGRDESGKGYIDLNFFNLFWIFIVASIIGDAMETLYHFAVVVPGQWQDRAGLLYGPFSPIYGFGALLMTLFLNRLYKRNLLIIFLFSAIIGGAFEYFVSYFMQYAFGAVAWDYTGAWLSIGGRTCGLAMIAWGLLGVVWIKLLLPLLLFIVNLIPWNWRYGVTVVAAILIATDCVMTLQSLDCWYERLDGRPVVTPIQEFYAEYYDNEHMANRFQSMTINPESAVRTAHGPIATH